LLIGLLIFLCLKVVSVMFIWLIALVKVNYCFIRNFTLESTNEMVKWDKYLRTLKISDKLKSKIICESEEYEYMKMQSPTRLTYIRFSQINLMMYSQLIWHMYTVHEIKQTLIFRVHKRQNKYCICQLRKHLILSSQLNIFNMVCSWKYLK